jgi:hypothetical protein
MAVDFPAPEKPVMITRSVSADPGLAFSEACSTSSVRDADTDPKLTSVL